MFNVIGAQILCSKIIMNWMNIIIFLNSLSFNSLSFVNIASRFIFSRVYSNIYKLIRTYLYKRLVCLDKCSTNDSKGSENLISRWIFTSVCSIIFIAIRYDLPGAPVNHLNS